MTVIALIHIKNEELLHEKLINETLLQVDSLLLYDRSCSEHVKTVAEKFSSVDYIYNDTDSSHEHALATRIEELEATWIIHLFANESVWSLSAPLKVILSQLPGAHDSVCIQSAKISTISQSNGLSNVPLYLSQRDTVKRYGFWTTRIQRVKPYLLFTDHVEYSKAPVYLYDFIIKDYSEALRTTMTSDAHSETQLSDEAAFTLKDLRINRELLVQASGDWPLDRMRWFHQILPINNLDSSLATEWRKLHFICDSYFEEKAYEETTLLGDILTSHGSQKEGSLHNYGSFYEHLWKSLKNKSIAMLELGIETASANTSLSMGAIREPGANLKAWKEYFTSADIYGADFNPDNLFYAERIKTYHLHSENQSGFEALYTYLDNVTLDIIITSHKESFSYNKQILTHLLPRLKKGGYCVIENVPLEYQHEAHSYIEEHRYHFSYCNFIKIPHQTNKLDNNLFIIVK